MRAISILSAIKSLVTQVGTCNNDTSVFARRLGVCMCVCECECARTHAVFYIFYLFVMCVRCVAFDMCWACVCGGGHRGGGSGGGGSGGETVFQFVVRSPLGALLLLTQNRICMNGKCAPVDCLPACLRC